MAEGFWFCKVAFLMYNYAIMEQKAITFELTSYKFEPLEKRVIFNYKTDFSTGEPLVFKEVIVLPQIPKTGHLPEGILEKLLQSLHIILGISYYKLYCATRVKLPYILTEQEAEFWNVVYQKGLGEFFYRNKLDPNISPKFPFSKNKKDKIFRLNENKKIILGIGGGKDSLVSAELLKQGGFDATGFSVQTNKDYRIIDEVIQKIPLDELKIQRFLDWQVHQKHQYAGHIPISAVYGFLGVFCSALFGYSYFVASNEHSSNFGNLKYKGLEINHQWSKSLEFEKLFQEYIKNYLSPDLSYFSLLRSFYEIRIVEIFSKYKKYFPHFSSCNRNFAIGHDGRTLWCGECPKCVFIFTLLSAFLKKEELIGIFGKNLYQNKNLLPLFNDVLGFGKIKPFDCVGTFEESQSAIFLAKEKFKNDFIIKNLAKRVKFYPEVLRTQKESLIPEQFKFFGMKNALIIGYGKEGIVTKEYLRKFYAKLKIGVADQKEGKNYLNKQMDFDIAVKTPGVKKENIIIPYTTATNIFFSKVKGKNKIVGITGSKGKSATSSLIYEILKKSGKKVELLGNIGKPTLTKGLRPIAKNTIFVLELSSYQLDDINFSPDIAVVTNLFPEHMDFHAGIKNYYQAKKNIIRFQDKEGYFVYNKKSKAMTSWLKEYKGKPVPFDADTKFKTSLLGEHNRQNIQAAVTVAKVLGVKQDTIKKTIEKFKGLPHRMEFVGEFKGIKFYDDAISTTPESTIMAIKSIKHISTIFLGGEDRGYDFSNLEKAVKKYKIKNVVLFPDSGKKILKNKKGLKVFSVKNMQEAVKFAYKNTKKGSVCLLSCASPSYSLWKNFEEKGGQFRHYVKFFGTMKQKN